MQEAEASRDVMVGKSSLLLQPSVAILSRLQGAGYLAWLQLQPGRSRHGAPAGKGLSTAAGGCSSTPTTLLPVRGCSRLQACLTAAAGEKYAPAPMSPPRQPQPPRLQLPGPAQLRCEQ